MSRARRCNVLFLCTGNSARSILAEAYLNSTGRVRFRAYSAGSHPAGKVNPYALDLLAKSRMDTSGLRSKSWDEFAQPGAPRMDFVFTVCDNAADEVCPIWPGRPITAHWGVKDPAAVAGSDEDKRQAFLHAFKQLSARINLLMNLPVEKGRPAGVEERAGRDRQGPRRSRSVSLSRRAFAEGLGPALLLAAVVGSGIMGERLSGGNDAITLLANSLATGFALIALIVAFAPRSGAHFNPVVTFALVLRHEFPRREIAAYVAAQVVGALIGVLAAHAMFDLQLLQYGEKARAGASQWWSEVVATFGLILVVLSCDQKRPWAAPFAVGGYIAAAYWFTASTSFANPAVTVARGFSATFTGIRPADVAPFILAQLFGAMLAIGADRALRPTQ